MTNPIALPHLLDNDFMEKLQKQIDQYLKGESEEDEPLPWDEEE